MSVWSERGISGRNNVFEYKVIGPARLSAEDLETELDKLARDAWKLSRIYVARCDPRLEPMTLVVLERKAQPTSRNSIALPGCICDQFATNSLKNTPTHTNERQRDYWIQQLRLMANELQRQRFLTLKLVRLPVPPIRP
jgi:hypothetical protein